jgi:hypothetical protein
MYICVEGTECGDLCGWKIKFVRADRDARRLSGGTRQASGRAGWVQALSAGGLLWLWLCGSVALPQSGTDVCAILHAVLG